MIFLPESSAAAGVVGIVLDGAAPDVAVGTPAEVAVEVVAVVVGAPARAPT